jgi:hypothetical protein
MIASAPAMSREAGQLLSDEVGEVRFVTAEPPFACPAVVAWLYRREVLIWAERLSCRIIPWDEWYHAMARRGWGGHANDPGLGFVMNTVDARLRHSYADGKG